MKVSVALLLDAERFGGQRDGSFPGGIDRRETNLQLDVRAGMSFRGDRIRRVIQTKRENGPAEMQRGLGRIEFAGEPGG